MKTLVAYYTRSGHTKRVAELIAKGLKADTDEIVDKTDRSGIRGWLIGGRDAYKNYLTEISCKDPKGYDLVIIGTPIWAATQTPAIRSYLSKYNFKKVAFFCTYGGSQGKAFAEMEQLSNKPLATLALRDRTIDASTDKIKAFCELLKAKK